MKRMIRICVAILALAFSAGPAVAADISGVPWTQANASTLNSFTKQDVIAFFDQQRSKSGVYLPPLAPSEVGQFRWADLYGNGQEELLLSLSGPCAHAISISSHGSGGRVDTVQTLPGWADLKTGIRDLDGGGTDELIIFRPLVEYDCASVVGWPAIYRLKKGKYVEASRDFPSYYDSEVLPRLETQIAKYHGKATDLTEDLGAGPIMERDKILRVLGRNPTAGLNQAYQWMDSDDPHLALDAAVTFSDIGGHEKEVSAARMSYTRAACRRQPGMAMCKGLALQSGSAPTGGSATSGGGGPAPPPIVHREVPPGRYAVPIHPGS